MNPWGVIRFVQQSRGNEHIDTVDLAPALAAASRILFLGDPCQNLERNPCVGFTAANLENVTLGYTAQGQSVRQSPATGHKSAARDAPIASKGGFYGLSAMSSL